MKAILIERKQIAEQTFQFDFDLSEELDFKAGQYVVIELINPLIKDEKSNKRFFSLVNPAGKLKQITIATRISESGFKQSLLTMPLQTEVELVRVGGNFLLPDTDKKSIFLAGGIGITPFLSMLRTMQQQEDQREVVLFYSCRNQDSCAYLNELTLLSTQLVNFKFVPVITNDVYWQGEKKNLDTKLIKTYEESLGDCKFMLVGPPKMVIMLHTDLRNQGIYAADILTESFVGY
jgi:ferredoxin-NADP reductase